jgi:hypothetical protein
MKANTTNPIVSVATAKLVKDAVGNMEKTNNQWLKASDALFADGVRAGMITGDGKVAEIQSDIKASIVLGLPVADRKLINGDTKAMDTDTKALRRTAQQKVGRYVSLIQGHLIRLAIESGEIEDPKTAEGDSASDSGSENSTKSVAEKLAVMLESCLKLVQGDESPEGYDPIIMAKALNQAAKAIAV